LIRKLKVPLSHWCRNEVHLFRLGLYLEVLSYPSHGDRAVETYLQAHPEDADSVHVVIG
jgi:hypothetical protein